LLVFNSFIVLAILSTYYGPLPDEYSVAGSALHNVVILIIGLNMATGGGMFDNQNIKPFPFLESISFTNDIFTNQFSLPHPTQ